MPLDVTFTIAHSPKARGAASADARVVEHDYSILICRYAVEYLNARGLSAEVGPVGSISQKIAWVNSKKPKCTVEPHLNATTTPKPSGHMVLYNNGSVRGLALAKSVSGAMAIGLKQFKNWGEQPAPGPMVRHPKLPYLSDTVCPAIITETLFVSNPSDVDWLASADAPRTLGMLIGDGVIGWLAGR